MLKCNMRKREIIHCGRAPLGCQPGEPGSGKRTGPLPAFEGAAHQCPVSGAMEQPYAPRVVQAQTRALLIPGFHGIQAVGAQPGNMAGLYGAAYQALQTG